MARRSSEHLLRGETLGGFGNGGRSPLRAPSRSPSAVRASSNRRAPRRALSCVARAVDHRHGERLLGEDHVARQSRRSAERSPRAPLRACATRAMSSSGERRGARPCPAVDATLLANARQADLLLGDHRELLRCTCSRHLAALAMAPSASTSASRSALFALAERERAASTCSCPPSASLSTRSSSSRP